MDLFQLVYVSSAIRVFQPEELKELLQGSRERNQAAGITGLLIYHGGNFIQAMEGPRGAVLDLERRIARNWRHHGMLVLLRRPITEREFGEHSMALARLGYSDGEEHGELRPVFEDERIDPPSGPPASPARKLLASFTRLAR